MVNNVLRESYVGEVLTKPIVDALIKNGHITINGLEITLVTERHQIYSGNGIPLLAFYPNKKYIDILDSIPNIPAMMIVPWKREEIQSWVDARQAVNLKPGGNPSSPIQLHLSKTVENALQTMTDGVNQHNGVRGIGPDRNICVEIFKILHNAGEQFYPNEVRIWLIQHRWTSINAEDASQIAQDILNGKKLRSTPHYRSDILEIWKNK